ncbi:30S ribosomal protein S6 modification protein [Vibrio gazogenes]|uniref:30S ribosomal protein S6 modification protein n=1 Tax=Vibrio gazogenes DSM 21264 = NBRC 103151 TaxID=1123492 RepID=A0A1M4YW47_VIBGA|nr:30S ribosomal protein S6 modification protein [Vibrio gazogenes]USP15119.1 hypothetical protein MKS89_07430 [Vibrio gazogenes]SHF09960.1 hypothetical protein SAMN02745781_01467 [Vibrio gazogenes DSM 21264] [Vibrio gazogenes DSM 21264 = NBRC 103151]SJN59277.1 hypothetical protein BQ6471_03399 [Vibrio gazogenes]
MQSHSKILVWYKVASQQVVLGEAYQDMSDRLVSLWLDTPTENDLMSDLGYHISLFGDDGRKIADKAISMLTADQLLGKAQRLAETGKTEARL